MALERHTALRSLPAVHRLLALEEAQNLLREYPDSMRTQAIGQVLQGLREVWEGHVPDEVWWTRETEPDCILRRARDLLSKRFTPHLRPVLNLTGTVIHTNLGRAPLSERALNAVMAVAKGYSNLEYDVPTGERGSRHDHVGQLLCERTGAEAALVVNNNAAAVLLVLQEMASGGEAIVSRGQLVEIGGSFRIPDIMRASGVTLVEVGATNKTKLQDYESALTAQTKLVLKVHTSNFRMIGFTEQPELSQLVERAHSHKIPVYEDLGSGALFDYERVGIGDEPTVGHSVACGVDVVSFSGDKLLGGAQAGIIVGKDEWISRMKKNALARALRVDKMTLAALEATLLAHVDDTLAQHEIPVVRMLTESYEQVADRCHRVYTQLCAQPEVDSQFTLELSDDESTIGGGALPGETLRTRTMRLSSCSVSAQELADGLRTVPTIPVVSRISKDAVILDARTLLPTQVSELVQSVVEFAKSLHS